MEILSTIWLGMPVWVWLGFVLFVLAIMAFDLGVLHREAHEVSFRESLFMSGLYVAIALAFAGVVYWLFLDKAAAFVACSVSNVPGCSTDAQLIAAHAKSPHELAWTATQLYLTGYVVEYTLAMDNVFVISLLFTYFAVPREYQHRVLFWGIIGVIVLRAIMIGLGATLIQNFAWILYVFAVILILTGIKLFWNALKGEEDEVKENFFIRWLRGHMRVTEGLREQRFFVREPDPKTGKIVLWATPLFLCLVAVEIADVIFAVDSVPAIFLITQDAFIVYTSNIFAIIGLRALYFTLAAMVHRFHYLKFALALVLIFIGSKIFMGDLFPSGKVPTEFSLGVTFALLIGGVLFSLWKTQKEEPHAKTAE
jgi:tellurite resistance protein TerC